MKKRIAITIALIMLMLPAQVLAEAEGTLTYERAVALMNLNNGTSQKLQRAETEAYRQYRSSVTQMESLDPNGFTYKINEKDYYFTYDPSTRQSLAKTKQLVPEQMEYAWESARDNHTATLQTLQVSLRSLFYGVYSAQSELELKQKQFALVSDINRQDKLKLKNGLITSLDLEESGYNVLKAQKEVDQAKRSYDNAVRSFNQFVGLPAANKYTKIINEDVLSHPVWKSVDYYVGEALANRCDITAIRKQLELKEHDKKLTEDGTGYKNNTTEQEQYEKLLNDIEGLEIDLKGMELSISNEIKNACADVMKAGKGVDSMGNTLKLQQSSYQKMQARYKAGMITKSDLTKAELGLEQTENSYKALIYDYNTKIMRFKNATGIGPGY